MSDDAKPTLKDRVKSHLNFSLAAIVSAIVGVLLLILALIAWLIYSVDPTRIAWGDYMTIGRSLGLIALWALSCAATYLTVRVWMNDLPVGDSRVRSGWDEGMKLLARHGVQLTDLPCFVVLGCETRHQQDAWVGSSGFTTGHLSSGATPAIDWHLNDERILIFCRDIGVYGGLLSSCDKSDEPKSSAPGTAGGTSIASNGQQPDRGESDENVTDVLRVDERNGEEQRGNEAFAARDEAATVALAAPRIESAKSATQSATVTNAMQTLDRADALVRDAQALRLESASSRPFPNSLSSIKTTACQDQLSQFCSRLRAQRFPHAPINGALVMVDSRAINDDRSSQGDAGRVMGRAIRSDLDQLQTELGIASPITMMIAENDHPEDYRELQRRLRMAEQDSSPPLGQTFVSEEIPTVDSMNRLANDAVRGIEHRVKQVFQVPRSLTQPQNHRLVRVLIQCRRWRSSLRTLMVESCAVNSLAHSSSPNESTPIVSGLFVASPTGGSNSGRFIDSVVSHMIAQQNHLTWTASEQRHWRQHRMVARALILATVALMAALFIQLWMTLAS